MEAVIPHSTFSAKNDLTLELFQRKLLKFANSRVQNIIEYSFLPNHGWKIANTLSQSQIRSQMVEQSVHSHWLESAVAVS